LEAGVLLIFFEALKRRTSLSVIYEAVWPYPRALRTRVLCLLEWISVTQRRGNSIGILGATTLLEKSVYWMWEHYLRFRIYTIALKYPNNLV
jgi:hypothetical protein